jgi:SAM-dependent methyltransferase
MKRNFYAKHLSALKLKQCYEIGSPRIQQYLEAEIQFVLSQIHPSDVVLELGCGYGRVLARIAKIAKKVFGIDNSKNNLSLADSYLEDQSNITLQFMDTKNLKFPNDFFHKVIAIQNGLSAFKINPEVLINEALRVTKKKGLLILSSYTEQFWEERLQWFIDQSNAGLLGEIDWEKTGDGIIKCKGGFIATSFYKRDFENLLSKLNLRGEILEIDDSCVFCVIPKE